MNYDLNSILLSGVISEGKREEGAKTYITLKVKVIYDKISYLQDFIIDVTPFKESKEWLKEGTRARFIGKLFTKGLKGQVIVIAEHIDRGM